MFICSRLVCNVAKKIWDATQPLILVQPQVILSCLLQNIKSKVAAQILEAQYNLNPLSVLELPDEYQNR